MRAISISRRKGQQGNTLLEFALFSTVLLMMTLGITDLGRVFNMGNTALAAAEFAAKWGALSPAHSQATDEIHSRAIENMAGYSGATATSNTYCTCGIGGSVVDCSTACAAGIDKKTYVQVNTAIPFHSLSGLPYVRSMTVTAKLALPVE